MEYIEYIYLGSTPADEPCAQVGQKNYEDLARGECTRYIGLLASMFIEKHGRQPNCKLQIKSNPHDFGTYFEVVIPYSIDSSEDLIKDAFWFDINAPATWDGQK